MSGSNIRQISGPPSSTAIGDFITSYNLSPRHPQSSTPALIYEGSTIRHLILAIHTLIAKLNATAVHSEGDKTSLPNINYELLLQDSDPHQTLKLGPKDVASIISLHENYQISRWTLHSRPDSPACNSGDFADLLRHLEECLSRLATPRGAVVSSPQTERHGSPYAQPQQILSLTIWGAEPSMDRDYILRSDRDHEELLRALSRHGIHEWSLYAYPPTRIPAKCGVPHSNGKVSAKEKQPSVPAPLSSMKAVYDANGSTHDIWNTSTIFPSGNSTQAFSSMPDSHPYS